MQVLLILVVFLVGTFGIIDASPRGNNRNQQQTAAFDASTPRYNTRQQQLLAAQQAAAQQAAEQQAAAQQAAAQQAAAQQAAARQAAAQQAAARQAAAQQAAARQAAAQQAAAQQAAASYNNDYGLNDAELLTDVQNGVSVGGVGGGYPAGVGYKNNNNNQKGVQYPNGNQGRGGNQAGGRQQPVNPKNKNQDEWSYQPSGNQGGFGYEFTDPEQHGGQGRGQEGSRHKFNSDSNEEDDSIYHTQKSNCRGCRRRTINNIGNGSENRNIVHFYRD